MVFPRTPVEFYKGNADRDPADTARNAVGVLDPSNNVRLVAPTGTRVITPNIEGVGKVRLRYPIFPVHSEGSTVGMELMVGTRSMCACQPAFLPDCLHTR